MLLRIHSVHVPKKKFYGWKFIDFKLQNNTLNMSFGVKIETFMEDI